MIAIWVRGTLDWADEQAFRAQLASTFAPRVELWNRTFTMPYHRFRAALRAIAADNLAQVAGVTVHTRLEAIPDGTLVLPVDDDDWFAPDIAGALARVDGARGCYWTSTFVERPIDLRHRVDLFRRRLLPSIRPKYTCTTNNYALVKHPDLLRALRSHLDASEWVDGPGADAVVHLPRRLSIMNRTLASQTSLHFQRPSFAPRLLRAKYREYRHYYRHLSLPAELAWARPYLARMDALMRELALR